MNKEIDSYLPKKLYKIIETTTNMYAKTNHKPYISPMFIDADGNIVIRISFPSWFGITGRSLSEELEYAFRSELSKFDGLCIIREPKRFSFIDKFEICLSKSKKFNRASRLYAYISINKRINNIKIELEYLEQLKKELVTF